MDYSTCVIPNACGTTKTSSSFHLCGFVKSSVSSSVIQIQPHSLFCCQLSPFTFRMLTTMVSARCYLVFLSIQQLFLGCCAFVPKAPHSTVSSPSYTFLRKTTASQSSTAVSMVFDFFRQRSKEGIDQLGSLANAAKRGELGKGLQNAASYTAATNKAFADGLAKSRNRLLMNMEGLFTGVSPEEFLDELEDTLLQADLGAAMAEDIVSEVRSLREDSIELLTRDDLKSVMRGKLIETLDTDRAGAIQFTTDDFPTVLFIMGANGMGKTTTIGKLAYRLKNELNQTVLMAACDTFRAGAVGQLEQWADRAECDIFTPNEKASTPSAVLYGALDKAIKENYNTLLVDTSGRLSNNDALTQELLKMKRVIQKRTSVEKDSDGKEILNTNIPHETLLVLDAAQGRMALDSAKVWDKEIGLTGLVLTKLDGSARGGSVVAISRDLALPVKLIGVGEGIEDLRDFEPESFVDGLLGIGKAGGAGGSANEGAMLAKRLVELRKERDARSGAVKKSSGVAEPKKVPAMAGQASTGTVGPMDSSADGVRQLTVPQKPNRPKNKKNNRKKR